MDEPDTTPEKDLFEEYPNLMAMLDALTETRDKQIELLGNCWQTSGTISQEDLMFQAICDRSVSLIDGFIVLVKDWNYIAAASLLRQQLDSMLRLNYVGRNPKERQRILHEWLSKTQFNNIQLTDDNTGTLSDKNLRDEIREMIPDIDDIYRELSDYIHLSVKHLSLTAFGMDESTRTIDISIGSRKDHLPESEYRKLFNLFIQFSRFISVAMEQWIEWKIKKIKE